jgi:pseudouridine synthase
LIPASHTKLTPEQISASNDAVTKSSQHTVDKSYLFCKPYACLSSFTKNDGSADDLDDEDGAQGHRTLRDVFVDAPTNIYPAGRLDYRSEGLLILTSNAFFKNALADPKNRLPKNYWVLVHGKPSEKQLNVLQNGMKLKVCLKIVVAVDFSSADACFDFGRVAFLFVSNQM